MRVGGIGLDAPDGLVARGSEIGGRRAEFLSFKAKDVTLYSDFDGTFLRSKSDTPEYYQAFEDFKGERNGKFRIFITTGRHLENKDGSGFLRTYNNVRGENPNFPHISGVVTANGGDVFLMDEAGEIQRTPLIQKRLAVRAKTGWNFDSVRGALGNIAQQLGTTFTLQNEEDFHRMHLFVADDSKIEDFNREVGRYFAQNGISAETHLKNIDGKRALKIAPNINGRVVHKDFDVKEAVTLAQSQNDFVIVAGNAVNDKELLNLFNYIGEPKINAVEKIPADGLETMIEQIKKLPLGVVFVEAPEEKMSGEKLKMKEFMEAQQKLFPDKVRIIKQAGEKGENNLVQACRELTEKFFPKEKLFFV